MADTSQQELSEPHTNGAVDGLTEEEKSKMRPADIDADMREMERRKRVEMMVNSRLFREELERIIETQMKDGAGPSGLLQQISDMMGAQGARFNGNVFKNSNCVVPINDIRGVESMGYAKGEKLLRCKLAAVFRLLDLYGWTQGVGGMITARLNQDQEHFLVNPYGLLYHEVTASSLVKVDMQGSVVEQGTTNFGVHITGFQLHSTIHAARPDIKCIVHITTPSVTAISSLKCGLLPIGQESIVIGEVSTHQYVGGSFEPEEREKITRNLGPMNKVMLLTNRGALCCGETVEEAFFNVYNTVLACETQLKLIPSGIDNISLISEESKKAIFEASRKPPIPQQSSVAEPSPLAEKLEKRWRIGGTEFEALMRMLDNAGFRTGYIYRHPLVKGEPPRPKNDVEVPPAVSSLGYLLEEEELYKQGLWKGGRKGTDRSRWLNSPNVYQKVEILETGTPDPKKITKWVDQNAEEWVSDGSPTHSSTPVKIDSALQFVPKNTNPKEFKQIQQQIKDYRRADKISAGPQSHILEGVTWEEAKKMQDATISGTGEQVVLVGAASKGIIQRGFQHNAMVYKTPYAKNPFDAVTDQELDQYKKEVERKQKGDIYDESQSESEALSSFNISRATHESSTAKSPIQSPVSVTSETEEESRDEPRVLRIETKQVPAPSQPEVVLSDESTKATSVIERPTEHKQTANAQAQQVITVDATTEFLNEMRRSAIEPQNNVSRRDRRLSDSYSSESEDLARLDAAVKLEARTKSVAERMRPRLIGFPEENEGGPRPSVGHEPKPRRRRFAWQSAVERRREFFENYEKRMLSGENKARGFASAAKTRNDVDAFNGRNASFRTISIDLTENHQMFLRNRKILHIDSVRFNSSLNAYPIPESVYFSTLRNKDVNVNIQDSNKGSEQMETEALIYSVGKSAQVNYVEKISLSVDDNKDYCAKSDSNGNDVKKSRETCTDNRIVELSLPDINGNVLNLGRESFTSNSCTDQVERNVNIDYEINNFLNDRRTNETKDINVAEIDENGNSCGRNDFTPAQEIDEDGALETKKSLLDLVSYIKDNLHSTVDNIEESFLERPAGLCALTEERKSVIDEVAEENRRKNEFVQLGSDRSSQENVSSLQGKGQIGTAESKVDDVGRDGERRVLSNDFDDANEANDEIISGSYLMSFRKLNGYANDDCRNGGKDLSVNVLQSFTSDPCLMAGKTDEKSGNNMENVSKNSLDPGSSSKCQIYAYRSDSCLAKKPSGVYRQDSITDVINSINVNIGPSRTTVDLLPETETSSRYNLDSTNMSLIYSLTLSADQCSSSRNTSAELDSESHEQSLEWQNDYAEKSVSSDGDSDVPDDSDYIWLDLLMTSTKHESTPTPTPTPTPTATATARPTTDVDVDLDETRDLFETSIDLGSNRSNGSAHDHDQCSNQGSDILELPAKTVRELKEIGGETFRSDISSVVDEIIDEINVAEICAEAEKVVDEICERLAAFVAENDLIHEFEADSLDSASSGNRNLTEERDENVEKDSLNKGSGVVVAEKNVVESVIVIDEIIHHVVDNSFARKSDSESSGDPHVKKRTKETTNIELKEMSTSLELQSKNELEAFAMSEYAENTAGIVYSRVEESDLISAEVKLSEGRVEEIKEVAEGSRDSGESDVNVNRDVAEPAKCVQVENERIVLNLESERDKVNDLSTSPATGGHFQNILPITIEESASNTSSLNGENEGNDLPDEVTKKPFDCPCLQCKMLHYDLSTADEDSEELHELSCSCEECKQRMEEESTNNSCENLSSCGEEALHVSFSYNNCGLNEAGSFLREEIKSCHKKPYECTDCGWNRKSLKVTDNEEEPVDVQENKENVGSISNVKRVRRDEEEAAESDEKATNNTDAVLEFLTVAEILPSNNDLRLSFVVEKAKDEDQEKEKLQEDAVVTLSNDRVEGDAKDEETFCRELERTESYYRGMSRYASTMELDKLNLIEVNLQQAQDFPIDPTSLPLTGTNSSPTYTRCSVIESTKQTALPAIYEESDESMEIVDESSTFFDEGIRETSLNETKSFSRERYPSYLDLPVDFERLIRENSMEVEKDFDRPLRTPESSTSVDYLSCSSGQFVSLGSGANSRQSLPASQSNSRNESVDEDSEEFNTTYTVSETSGNERQFEEPLFAEYNADVSANMDETRGPKRHSDSSLSEMNFKVNGNGNDDSVLNFADISTNVLHADDLEEGGTIPKKRDFNRKCTRKSYAAWNGSKPKTEEIVESEDVNVINQESTNVDRVSFVEENSSVRITRSCIAQIHESNILDPMASSYDTQEFILLEQAVAENSEPLGLSSEVD